VNVPFWATFATNQLITPSGPVEVWFNQNQLPTGNFAVDTLFMPATTIGVTNTLSALTLPVLNPGQTYYLGVRSASTNASCATFAFQIDYNVTALGLSNVVHGSIQGQGGNSGPSGGLGGGNSVPQYYSYNVTSNETGIVVLLTNITGGNVDMVISKEPFPTLEGFDYASFNPGTDPESIAIFTNSTPVPLTPGTWYIGVFNRDTNTVNYDIVVNDFTGAIPNIIQLYLNQPYGNTNNSSTPDYYRYTANAYETGVEFQLLGLSGDVNLYAHRGWPLPSLGPPPFFDYSSTNPGTIDEDIVVFTNSTPVALAAGDWYLSVYNFTAPLVPVSYTALVTDTTSPFANIITLTNAIPYGNNNNYPLGGVTNLDYYRFVVSNTVVRAQFEIDDPSAHVALAVHRGLPLPNLTLNDYLSNNGGTNNQLITVFDTSAPVPLTPGEWFLTAINLSGVPVNYSIKATEYTQAGTNIVIGHPTVVSNEFCFSWSSLPGVPYTVQGKPLLSVTNWSDVETVIGFGGTNTTTTACIPLPSPYQFFRVIEGGYPVSTNAVKYNVRITSITRTPAGVLLKWLGPIGSIFQVQWSSGSLPPVWNTFTNVITSTNGQCSFLDNGTQSGGVGGTRYYRLVQ
jgi:hypothetical protein